MSEELTAVSQHVASNGGLNPMYAMIGLWVVREAAGGVVAFIKYMSARTVAREDADKADMQKKLEKLDERDDDLEETLNDMEKAVDGIQKDVKACSEGVSDIKNALGPLQKNLDDRLAGQQAFYLKHISDHSAATDKKLEDLEVRIRQDAMRAIADAAVRFTSKKR